VSIEALRQSHPGLYLLDPADPTGVEVAMRKASLLADDERVIRCSRAGEGNMNCTVRVETSRRSLILKQSRPWVEKYPSLAAPWDRVCREWEFYQAVRGVAGVADRMPSLLHLDAEARWMAIEDLGEAGDYTGIYRGEVLRVEDLEALADFLGRLHRIPREAGRAGLENRGMRALNHAHVFRIPFQAGNGLDLEAISPGLSAAAARVHGDAGLVKLGLDLGRDVYLADGETLIHGDFFPGSLVRTPGGPCVIDPEFGFHGRAEYDVGVWLGHLVLAGQPEGLLDVWRQSYRPPADFDEALAIQLAGVEVIRRLIGYAQLPLGCRALGRIRRLDVGVSLMRSPTVKTLREGLVEVRSTEGNAC
jgi:5-methylthioribose kinase